MPDQSLPEWLPIKVMRFGDGSLVVATGDQSVDAPNVEHYFPKADLPAIIEQARQEERERLRGAAQRDLTSDGGPLGEAIADAAGNYALEFVAPEHVAEGICAWLASRQPDQSSARETDDDGRANPDDPSGHAEVQEGAEGSRIGRPSTSQPQRPDGRIEAELCAYPEVRWDRFITYAGKVRAYGWLDRDDGRADFLLLDFDAETGALVEWITSANPHPASVVERLEGEQSVECQRVEDYFDVPNAVRLADQQQHSTEGGNGEEAEDCFESCDNCERPTREDDLKVIWCKDAESGEPVDARICAVCRFEAKAQRYEEALREILTKKRTYIYDGPLGQNTETNPIDADECRGIARAALSDNEAGQ